MIDVQIIKMKQENTLQGWTDIILPKCKECGKPYGNLSNEQLCDDCMKKKEE